MAKYTIQAPQGARILGSIMECLLCHLDFFTYYSSMKKAFDRLGSINFMKYIHLVKHQRLPNILFLCILLRDSSSKQFSFCILASCLNSISGMMSLVKYNQMV